MEIGIQDSERTSCAQNAWIPAFAGMTNSVDS